LSHRSRASMLDPSGVGLQPLTVDCGREAIS
jgi:hypothetical protein